MRIFKGGEIDGWKFSIDSLRKELCQLVRKIISSPLFWPFLLFVIGILLGVFFDFSAKLVQFLLLPVGAMALVLWSANRKFASTIVMAVFIVIAGIVIINGRRPITPLSFPSERITITVSVASWQKAKRGVSLLTRLKSISGEDDLHLQTMVCIHLKRNLEFKSGEILQVTGQLELPNQFHNSIQYQQGLREKFGPSLLILKNAKILNRIKPSGLTLWRNNLLYRLDKSLLRGCRPDEKSILLGLVLGEKIDSTIRDNFREAGLLHIIVISGFHLTLLINLLKNICYGRRGILLLMFLLPQYAWLCGSGTSLVRAVIMGECLLIGELRGEKIDSFNSLLLAGILLLYFDPLQIFNVGFHFSMAATACLLLFPINNKNWQSWFLTSFAVLPGIIPISIFFYGYCNLTTCLATPLAAPLCQVLLVSSLVTLPLQLLFVNLPAFLLLPSRFLASSLLSLADLFSRFSLIYNLMEILLIILVIFLVVLLYKMPQKWVFAGILLLVLWQISKATLEYKIDFIDVGQGNSVLLRLPNRRMLIDTGDARGLVFQRSMLPWFHREGIHSLTDCIISHLDSDHAGNAGSIASWSPTTRFWFPLPLKGKENLRKFVSEHQLDEKKIGFLVQGDQWLLEKGKMNVLWPPKKCETSDDNFQSLVLQLTISGKSFLLMGDVPSSVESKLLRNSLDQQYLLLVSHHGSNTATSEPFLRQTMPENIVISVGKNNRYGHPNPQTIHRIAKVEGRVLMTSKNGRIHFTFKNQQVSFNCVKSWDK